MRSRTGTGGPRPRWTGGTDSSGATTPKAQEWLDASGRGTSKRPDLHGTAFRPPQWFHDAALEGAPHRQRTAVFPHMAPTLSGFLRPKK